MLKIQLLWQLFLRTFKLDDRGHFWHLGDGLSEINDCILIGSNLSTCRRTVATSFTFETSVTTWLFFTLEGPKRLVALIFWLGVNSRFMTSEIFSKLLVWKHLLVLWYQFTPLFLFFGQQIQDTMFCIQFFMQNFNETSNYVWDCWYARVICADLNFADQLKFLTDAVLY